MDICKYICIYICARNNNLFFFFLETMNLKGGDEGSVGDFGGRKGKGEMQFNYKLKRKNGSL